MNVDAQAMDWATLVQRRAKTDPVEQGGWSIFHTSWSGLDQINPAGHVFLRGNGKARRLAGRPVRRSRNCAMPGSRRPISPRKRSWREQLQLQAFQDVPYIPLGQYFQPTAYQANLTGVLPGNPVFWNIRRS